jgi:hypothetical protein
MIKEFLKNVGRSIFIMLVITGASIIFICFGTLIMVCLMFLKSMFDLIADNQHYIPIVFGFILIVLYLYDRFRNNKTK